MRIVLATSCTLFAAQAVLSKEGDQTREFTKGCKITCLGGDWTQGTSGNWSCSTQKVEKSKECPARVVATDTVFEYRNSREFEGLVDAAGNTLTAPVVLTPRRFSPAIPVKTESPH
jgi:hypothetical protein